MGRRKNIRRCFGCGILYTWEKGANDANGVFVPNPEGSVRKVTLDTKEIHPLHCSGKVDKIVNDYSEKPAPVPVPSFPPVPVKPAPAVIPVPAPVPAIPTPEEIMDDVLSPAGREIYKLIEPAIVENFDRLAENIKLQGRTVNHRVEVITPDYHKVIEGCHRQSAELLRALAVKIPTGKPGIFNRPNVLLVGPAGTGKSTAAEHAAEALGLNFFPISVGPQTTKSDFFGFTSATGKPVWSVIRRAFVDGGILLIDEIDSASAGALTYINGLLANSKVSFPGEGESISVETKHHDFCVVAAANTYGNGGSRMYVRNELDKATTDRFIGIDWAYDIDLEQRMVDSKHFSGNVTAPEERASVNNHAFVSMPFGDFVWKLRRAQGDLKLRLIYGTRKILIGCAMLDHGFSRSDVENMTLWFGVEADSKAKLLAHVAGQR